MDKVLKQRLVGASILIALAVIFVPMLFHDGGDDAVEQRELSLDLPERGSGDRQVRRLPLDPDQARRPPPSDSQAQPPRDTRPEPQPVQEEEQAEPARQQPDDSTAGDGAGSEAVQPEASADDSVPEAATAEPIERDDGDEQEESAPEPETPEPVRDVASEPEPESGAPVAGDWVVQVAVFSNRETANSIRQRLDELGHRVAMDVLIRNQAELFRLRTGPYADESAADQARGQIAATVAGVDPATRELSGNGASEDRQGLVVQVGSFASHNNAERLVGQLTEAGFDAFMYGEEAGGRTIWRVRVGAYENRADAERLLETLRDERGLEGIVVSHP